MATIAAAVAVATVAGGCVSVKSSSESYSDVDIFRLSSNDLPAGYDVLELTGGGACALRRTRRQVKELGATHCDDAVFSNGVSSDDGRTYGRLFTYRFLDEQRAAAALPRMRRSALRRFGMRSPIIGVDNPDFGPALFSRHSLAVSGLGDDAPRGVRLEQHATRGHRLLYAVNLYLWRDGSVVAGLSVAGRDEMKSSGATGLAGNADPQATLRIAQRIDKHVRGS